MIIVGYPPNFEQVKTEFPNAEKPGVMFAYDNCIYNPSGVTIPPALIAHEEVHLKRQVGGPETWWRSYIENSEFRYVEELLAHVAEFKVQRNLGANDRNFGARLLMHTAMRLVAPLYNYQPPRSLQEAIKDLRREIANAKQG